MFDFFFFLILIFSFLYILHFLNAAGLLAPRTAWGCCLGPGQPLAHTGHPAGPGLFLPPCPLPRFCPLVPCHPGCRGPKAQSGCLCCIPVLVPVPLRGAAVPVPVGAPVPYLGVPRARTPCELWCLLLRAFCYEKMYFPGALLINEGESPGVVWLCPCLCPSLEGGCGGPRQDPRGAPGAMHASPSSPSPPGGHPLLTSAN